MYFDNLDAVVQADVHDDYKKLTMNDMDEFYGEEM